MEDDAPGNDMPAIVVPKCNNPPQNTGNDAHHATTQALCKIRARRGMGKEW